MAQTFNKKNELQYTGHEMYVIVNMIQNLLVFFFIDFADLYIFVKTFTTIFYSIYPSNQATAFIEL